MQRYFRANMYLGTMHEIPEKEALRKINSKWWVQHWDSYWEEFRNMWINTRDMDREVIFMKEDSE